MRHFLLAALLAFFAACSPKTVSNDKQEPKSAPKSGELAITVYKSPTCGCCGKWIEHMEANGFNVTPVDTNELVKIKMEHGIPGHLHSCHTGIINGYVVEGHVPADVVKDMLKKKPQAAGVAVPGMPVGSPGMEGSYTEAYDVLTFTKEGKTEVFASR